MVLVQVGMNDICIFVMFSVVCVLMQTILKIQSICWLHFSLQGFICNSIGCVVWEGAGCHLAFQILSSSHNSQLIFQSLCCVGGSYTLTSTQNHIQFISVRFTYLIMITHHKTFCLLSGNKILTDHSWALLGPVVASILRVPRGGCLRSWVTEC